MGYHILRFEENGDLQWGVLKGDKVAPFAAEINHLKDIMDSHLGAAKSIATDSKSGSINLSDVRIVSPVSRPTRLLCLGLNYYEHRAEVKADTHSKQTLFFRKDESSITGPTDDIFWPKGCNLLDYEVEMGLVIKKAITTPIQVTPENIGDYVAGMILVNDMSPRDLMFFTPYSQWYMGKSQRSMCPMGPYIYIFDEGEASQMHNMKIKLWVNDDLRQDAHTKDMITSPEKALTLASDGIDLESGDVLVTGTPGGVAVRPPGKEEYKRQMAMEPKERAKVFTESQLKTGRFLKEGDVVRCTLLSEDGQIDMGELKNTIVKK